MRPLYLSMNAAWIMSMSALICVSPNICLSIENTRSAAAELGVREPTICASLGAGANLIVVCKDPPP